MALQAYKYKFEKWSNAGCSESSYEFVVTTCCCRICVVDDELSDLYYDPRRPEAVFHLYDDDLPCPICGALDWEYSGTLGVQDGAEYVEWSHVSAFDGSTLIDLSGLYGQEAFHDYIASRLELPDYYGRNLDALLDCLVDYSIGVSNHIIRIEGVMDFKSGCPDIAEKALRVFADLQYGKYIEGVVLYDHTPSKSYQHSG
jgi:hypothetical protein